jgi:hypothetical protein
LRRRLVSQAATAWAARTDGETDALLLMLLLLLHRTVAELVEQPARPFPSSIFLTRTGVT